jgi:hypothetical protein
VAPSGATADRQQLGWRSAGSRGAMSARQGYAPGNTVDPTGPDPINGIARCASDLTICQLCPLATQTYRRPLTRLSVRSAVSSWCCAGAWSCSARRACTKAGPYEVSRSRMRYRGAWSHGNASVTWREIHSAVGFAVTPNDTQSRTHNDKTMQNLECDRRQDKEVDRRDAVDVIAEKRSPALRRWRHMCRATVDWATSKPSLSNSP